MTVFPDEPMRDAYVHCVASGCAADYAVTDDVIGKMKNSQTMIVEGIDPIGTVPVSGFGQAYDGPPADLEKFWSIYERPPKPWKDDTLQPHLRSKY